MGKNKNNLLEENDAQKVDDDMDSMGLGLTVKNKTHPRLQSIQSALARYTHGNYSKQREEQKNPKPNKYRRE